MDQISDRRRGPDNTFLLGFKFGDLSSGHKGPELPPFSTDGFKNGLLIKRRQTCPPGCYTPKAAQKKKVS